MLVVTRHHVPAGDGPRFLREITGALDLLAACTGFVSGRVGRSTDDPTLWSLTTEWQSVGAYRRALSDWDVKLHAVPVLSTALDEPSAYETLVTRGMGGPVLDGRTALAADAGSVSLGEAAAPTVDTDLP
ncbi:MAG: antibiotic biosynthesis monooxygenase [Candidatus Nanopelagicales bacterium]